jgi:site-specific recombinase XerD
MKEEKTTPRRKRMMEDMDIRGLCKKTQQGHIRCVKHFAALPGRSPDTATPDDLRAYQLQMTKDMVSATTFNMRIISLRFFFRVTCGREGVRQTRK